VHTAGDLEQPLGQNPLTTPHLEYDVLRIERRIGEDRFQQVRIGKEVLA
jgi:hypothetical protein